MRAKKRRPPQDARRSYPQPTPLTIDDATAVSRSSRSAASWSSTLTANGGPQDKKLSRGRSPSGLSPILKTSMPQRSFRRRNLKVRFNELQNRSYISNLHEDDLCFLWFHAEDIADFRECKQAAVDSINAVAQAEESCMLARLLEVCSQQHDSYIEQQGHQILSQDEKKTLRSVYNKTPDLVGLERDVSNNVRKELKRRRTTMFARLKQLQSPADCWPNPEIKAKHVCRASVDCSHASRCFAECLALAVAPSKPRKRQSSSSRRSKSCDVVPPGTVVSLAGLERVGEQGKVLSHSPRSGRYTIQVTDSHLQLRVAADHLPQRVLVRVTNVGHRPELSGKQGTLISWDAAQHRYTVHFADTADVATLKPANVVLGSAANGAVGKVVGVSGMNGKLGKLLRYKQSVAKYKVEVSERVIEVGLGNFVLCLGGNEAASEQRPRLVSRRYSRTWQPFDIFFVHVGAQKREIVAPTKEVFENAGFNCFLDLEMGTLDGSPTECMQFALETCRHAVVVISKEMLEKEADEPPCQELAFAFRKMEWLRWTDKAKSWESLWVVLFHVGVEDYNKARAKNPQLPKLNKHVVVKEYPGFQYRTWTVLCKELLKDMQSHDSTGGAKDKWQHFLAHRWDVEEHPKADELYW